jgi:hypothetical protein
MKKESTMKEKLTCNSCSKNWTRNRTRGRKPLFCPKCAETLSSQKQIQKPIKLGRIRLMSMAEKSEKTKNNKITKQLIEAPSNWQCPSCLVSVILNVGVYDPPTHWCKKRMKKIFPLEQVKKIIKSV